MRVVDTSALVEWFADKPTRKLLAPEMPAPEEFVVPTIVQLELAKWAARELGDDKIGDLISFTRIRRVAPLDTNIALLAAEICSSHKLATADAIIYATAVEYGADLLTCDAHFKDLPGVVYVPKA